MNQFPEEDEHVTAFCAKLIAEQSLPKNEYKRYFEKESFSQKVDAHLSQVGMELLTHVYSDYYVVGLKRTYETALEKKGEYYSNNLGMSRNTMALLTIVWCLLILPKREKQTQKQQLSQLRFLRDTPRPLRKEEEISIPEEQFKLEYSDIFGKKSKVKFGTALNELVRLNFLKKRIKNSVTHLVEGPLLDTLIDYKDMMDHIEQGMFEDLPKHIHPEIVQISSEENPET